MEAPGNMCRKESNILQSANFILFRI